MTTTRPAALVTSVSSGIGKASALAQVERGLDVVDTSREVSRAAPLVDLDVAREASDAAAGQVVERFGPIDVLVNEAGVGQTTAGVRAAAPRL